MQRKPDAWILVPCMVLLGFSVLFVFSSTAVTSERLYGDSSTIIRTHLLHLSLGLVALLAALRINPKLLRRISIPLALFFLLLLVLVLIPGIGQIAGGARRWLNLGGFRFQPGELAKIGIILYMSSYIGRNHNKMLDFVPGTLVPFCTVGAVALLLLLQPDFGTTVIVMLVVVCQLLSVSRIRHLSILGMCGLGALILLAVSSPYRFRRIQSFLDPLKDASAAGYQLVQSLIAVGSGGLTGEGLGVGNQKLFYLPAAHTDFIFAVIAEELGMAGAVTVLLLFLVIGYRGLSLARRLSPDPYLSSLAIGCTLIIVIPALLNMGVVLGLFPTKGLVLPLVAYGGTAMIVHLSAIGMLLRLSCLEIRAD